MVDAKQVSAQVLEGLVLGWWQQEEEEDGQWLVWKFRETKGAIKGSDESGMTQEEGERQMNMLRVSHRTRRRLFFTGSANFLVLVVALG